jgi:hypothetical protein
MTGSIHRTSRATTPPRSGRRRSGQPGRPALSVLPLAAVAALALTACSGGSTAPSADASAPQQSATTSAPADTTSATASSSPSSTPSSTPSGPVECTTKDLRVDVVPGQSAAGQRYAALVLTNTSAGPCFVVGYPGLQLVSASGGTVPTDVVRADGDKKRVTLAAGEKASTLMHWSVVPGPGEPTDSACEPTAASLLVTPPDQTTQLKSAWEGGPVCLKGRIDVRPLEAGSDPQP